MKSKIDPSLLAFAMNIDELTPLENNPRRGDIKAIKASYEKFGQLRPIVAVNHPNGDTVVIAGNHQLEAAKQLGWDQIAVAIVELNDEDAITFALSDNRISELGSTDNSVLMDLISRTISTNSDFFDLLGWDDFSMAAMENVINSSIFNDTDHNHGWSAPEIIFTQNIPDKSVVDERITESIQGVTALPSPTIHPDNVDTQTIVTQGSTSTSASGSKNAVIQFTIVFENAEQQSKWYSFIRWLKGNPAYDGDTTADRLLDFIAQHSPKG